MIEKIGAGTIARSRFTSCTYQIMDVRGDTILYVVLDDPRTGPHAPKNRTGDRGYWSVQGLEEAHKEHNHISIL